MNIRNIAGLLTALIVLGGIIVLAVVRGGQDFATQDGKLSVAATYYPLYDFAKRVGGDAVSVRDITPAGAEPHDYEPSPQTLAQVQQADVFVYNGGTLEPWVNNFVQGYKHQAVKASSSVPLVSGVGEDGTSASGIRDPHFWLDPVYAQTIVATIRDGLIKADPHDAAVFNRNAAVYTKQLEQLDADFRSGLQTCQTRTIVTSHAAFGYVAKRYNLHVVSIAGLSPDEEPSAAKLATITQTVQRDHIHYIFFEKLVSPRLADTIANETGAKTAVFDPIEGLDDAAQKNGQNYLTVQRANLGALRVALACQ